MVATMTATEDWFLKSRLFQDLEKKREAERQTEREQAVKRLAALDTKYRDEVMPLEKAGTDADKAVIAARKALEKALAKAGDIAEQQQGVAHQIDRERAQCERLLLETASPQIDEFIRWVEDALHGDTHREAYHHEQEQGWAGKPGPLRNNWAAVKGWVKSMKFARQAARELKLKSLTEEQVTRALAEIKAGIPDLDKIKRELQLIK